MLEIANKSAIISIADAVIDTSCIKSNLSGEKVVSNTVNRWSVADIVALFELPFSDLMYQSQNKNQSISSWA